MLAYRNGAPMRVRDVGQAIEDQATDHRRLLREQLATLLIIAVIKQPGANVIETVDQIKARLPQLTAAFRPPSRSSQFSTAPTIRASVADVEFTLALTICWW